MVAGSVKADTDAKQSCIISSPNATRLTCSDVMESKEKSYGEHRARVVGLDRLF